MTIYAYARVSTARQASEGESLDVQQRQINGYALMHGFAVDEAIIEEGVSGSVPVSERPAGEALFAKLKAGDVVIAAKLDRLFRSALDALQVVEDLRSKGVKLHLIDLGGDIAGNGLSKLFFTIASAFAEAERDRIRERISQVKADQRTRNRFLGGARPFGYQIGGDGELVEDATEQKAIARMHELRGQGLSLRAVAEALAKDGIALSHVGVQKVLERSA
ncbi:recombinase family protein [Mesorhizobium sp.]|uniref:recombinase family protein n=1 Tax=Mesorhizobium sp. TaxID=1871066 RepID=UPI000FE30EA6|nr:recombinase family protein [Mesorhizobium sp.]RWN58460.1 MAG: recombinase family protein [Mesorhizobium sp.]RWN98186.1 MAG: recombinase family protein [Mesorhizobium sp.]